MFKIVFGAVLAGGLLLASDARPLDYSQASIIDERQKEWTMEDLSAMAKSRTMENVVSSITSAAQGPGTPALDMDEMKALIKDKPAAELRAALLAAASIEKKRKKTSSKIIADFLKAVDSAATCATEETAGGHGIAVCVAGCEDRSRFLGWASRDGACEVLCSLATSGCTKEPVLWETFDIAKSWTMSTIGWIAKLSLRVKVFFLIFVKLANTLRVEVEIGRINARIRKVDSKQWRCTRDYDAMKGAVLVELHERLLKKRALYALHDFGALATYRAAQEAAAAEAAATKAMALKAAIDTVASEQATRDKGGGGCVLS